MAALPLVAWASLLAAAVGLLHAVGGALAPPPLADPGALHRWLDGRQPAEAAFAAVRLVTLGVAWYLLAVTVLATVVRLAGAAWMVRAADVVTVPVVRRLATRAFGASLAAVVLTGAGAGAPVVAALADAPAGSAVPTMRRLSEAPPPGVADTTATTTSAAAPAATPPAAAPAATPPAAAPAATTLPSARTWSVQPGEHFWAVADKILTEAWSRRPGDAEVAPYWRAVVEANRAVLRDPHNPDLLFPGQVISVPAPPAPPA